jgi:predicted  nucleic acid-binding Zn-ribbon protein
MNIQVCNRCGEIFEANSDRDHCWTCKPRSIRGTAPQDIDDDDAFRKANTE